MNMNEVDIAILAVVALSAFFGLWRGLVKEVLSLVTWVAALVVAGCGAPAEVEFSQGRYARQPVRPHDEAAQRRPHRLPHGYHGVQVLRL